MKRELRSRILKWTLFGSIASLLLAAVFLWFALNTRLGTRLALSQLHRLSPVHVEGSTGALRGPLELSGIRIELESASLQIDRLLVDWRPLKLLVKRLEIDSLRALGARISVKPAQPSTAAPVSEPRRFEPPLNIRIGKAIVEQVEVSAPRDIQIRDGRLELSGELADYALAAEAVLLGPDLPETRLQLSGRGDGEHVKIEPLNLGFPAGRAVVQGRVAWYPQISWLGSVHAEGVAITDFLPDPALWPGQLSLRGRAQGSLNPDLNLHAELDTLYGDLRDQPVSARADLTITANNYSIRHLDLLWGSTRLHAAGAIHDSVDVTLEADAPNLANTLPGAAGSARVVAHAFGPRDQPSILADVAASAIEFRGTRLNTLLGQVNLDLADPSSALLELDGSGLSVAGRTIERIVVNARGVRSPAEGDGVMIETLEAQALGGRLSLRGWFTWQRQPRWRLSYEANGIAPATLFSDPAQWPGRISVRGSGEGSLTDEGAVGRVAVDTLSGVLRQQRLSGRATIDFDVGSYSVPALAFDWGAARLRASGRIDESLDLAFDLRAPDLALLFPEATGSALATGQVRGTPSAPVIRAELDLDQIRYADYAISKLTGDVNLGNAQSRPAEFSLRALGMSVGALQVDSLTLQGQGVRSGGVLTGFAIEKATSSMLEGTVLAAGQLTWRPRVAWQFEIVGDSLAPASLFSEPERWPGRLSFRGGTDGALSAGRQAAGRLSVDTLQGMLRERPVSARAVAAFEAGEYSLPVLELLWGATTVHATGRVGDVLDIGFEVEAPDLAAVLPGAAGSLSVAGDLVGSRAAPQVNARLHAQAIQYESFRLRELRGRADVDLSRPGKLDLDLTASALRWGERAVDRFSLIGRGTRVDHELVATFRSADPEIDLTLVGGWTGEIWRGELRQLQLRSTSAGDWQLRDAAQLSAAPQMVRLQTLCLDATDAGLCAEGSWQRDGAWRLTSSLRGIPLSLSQQLLPTGWSLAGTMDGDVDAAVEADGRLRAEIDLQPGPGSISYPLADAKQTVNYDRGSLILHGGEDGVRGTIDLSLNQEGARFGFLRANLQLPDYSRVSEPLRDQPINAQVEAQFNDLTPLQALPTRLARTSGRLEVDVNVSGTVERPRLLGELNLRDGQADVPDLGLRLRDVQLTASGDGRGGVLFNGGVRSGPGRLTVTGESPLVPTGEAPIKLNIRGERFQIVNTPNVQLLVSPNVETQLTGERVMLSGEIRVPQASVELSELPQTAVPVSKDEVILGGEVDPLRRGANVEGRIRLVLENDVYFKGFGFTANLAGSLLAIEEPGKPTAGSGELVIVGGQYKAYGQTLTIDRGRVLFGGGPIDNPGLDARASRTASDGVIAGVFIRGTVKEPEVTLFSEPPMTESEALSYLLLGRPITEASQSEGNMLSSAANSLGLKGGNLLARGIATGFGLDEARIEGGRSLRDASFVAGKYLSPRLYVIYGIGLFDQASKFRVRYLLSSRWTLVGETGEATSTDLLYRIERGS